MIKGQLTDADRTEIVKYRLEKAYRTYNEAVGSIKNGYVETAANRLYYAAYYAVSALLLKFNNGKIGMRKISYSISSFLFLYLSLFV